MNHQSLDPVLNDLIRHLSVPAVRTVNVLGRAAETRVFVGRTTPSFTAAYFDPVKPQVVGTLGDHEVRVDPMLKFPKLTVSKKFRDMFPEHSQELQDWMSKSFGYDYPVYIEGKTILLHPDALDRLTQKLAGQA